MKVFLVTKFIFCFSVFVVFTGCGTNKSENPATYHPTFSSDTSKQNVIVMGYPNFSYSETGKQMVQYLNAHLSDTQIKVHACVDWNEYIRFLNEGKFDITLINGMVASEAANNGYTIVGKVTSDSPYSSLIITRKNSDIRKPTDLKGKKIAMVPSHIIPSTMMGMYYLYQNGLNVNFNIHTEGVASFEAGILSVYLGESDAGICARRNWNVYVKEHPEILSKLEIKWETEPLEHNAILIKNTVDKKVVSDIMNVFISMRDKKDAKAALESLDINGFEKADSGTYKNMMDFKKKYDAEIFSNTKIRK